MASKIEAAVTAVKPGSLCNACVVAAGSDLNIIRSILGSDSLHGTKGTLFVTPGTELEKQVIADIDSQEENGDVSDEARKAAVAARDEARKLQALPHQSRQNILRAVQDQPKKEIW